jgi:hypothetical protein
MSGRCGILSSKIWDLESDVNYTECTDCYLELELCQCVCPYCGGRDSCQCALFDAATGG